MRRDNGHESPGGEGCRGGPTPEIATPFESVGRRSLPRQPGGEHPRSRPQRTADGGWGSSSPLRHHRVRRWHQRKRIAAAAPRWLRLHRAPRQTRGDRPCVAAATGAGGEWASGRECETPTNPAVARGSHGGDPRRRTQPGVRRAPRAQSTAAACTRPPRGTPARARGGAWCQRRSFFMLHTRHRAAAGPLSKRRAGVYRHSRLTALLDHSPGSPTTP